MVTTRVLWISDHRISTNNIIIQSLPTWYYGTEIISKCTLFHSHKDK